MQGASPFVRAKRAKERTIVDPTAWDSSDVGGAEGTALRCRNARKSKVSSIRSSLFQKSAKSILSDGGANVQNDTALVFVSSGEAALLDSDFGFELNSATAMALCEYGKSNKKFWVKDVLALTHNAIRSEVADLVIMLKACKIIRATLTVGDMSNIRSWWHTFSSVLLDYLDLEAKILQPWIQAGMDSTKSPDSACAAFVSTMPTRQHELRGLVVDVAKAFGELCDGKRAASKPTEPKVSRCEKAMHVFTSLDRLISAMSGYMWDSEERLSGPLSAVYKNEKKEREAIMTAAISHIAAASRNPDIMFVLHTRWMTDSKGVKSYAKQLQDIYDCSLSRLQAQFEVNHAGVVHQFRVKARM